MSYKQQYKPSSVITFTQAIEDACMCTAERGSVPINCCNLMKEDRLVGSMGSTSALEQWDPEFNSKRFPNESKLSLQVYSI